MKNLVYFSVFYNKDYFKLADLLLKSMKFFSPPSQFDILVLTNRAFQKEAEELSAIMPVNIHYLPLDTIFQAACARLRIFDYPNIHTYSKILYLDTDIIIKKDLNILFDEPLSDVVHGLESGTIGSPNFGSQFFDFNTIDIHTTGINSGTLLFNNCDAIQALFARMLEHINNYTDAVPYCMDQPFINYHAIRDKLYNNSFLRPHVSLYEDNAIVDNDETSSICHFSFPIGNFHHKYHRMSEFFKQKLRDQWPKGKSFSWGVNGLITFNSNTLDTTWGTGTYTVMAGNKVCATWNNHEHILQFDSTLTRYDSIRVRPSDFNYTSGTLTANMPIYIYGDSHADAVFRNLSMVHYNKFQYSVTMHRIGRDNTIINFNKTHLSKNSVFCLVYGEVDVRCHIGKQIADGRSEDDICKELVNAYFKTIRNNITEYKAIIVVGIPPPTDISDHTHTHTLPFVGTNDERVHYTHKMNTLLKQASMRHGFVYFGPYEYCTRGDGCMDYSMSDGCIHIGNNTVFLEQFTSFCKNKLG